MPNKGASLYCSRFKRESLDGKRDVSSIRMMTMVFSTALCIGYLIEGDDDDDDEGGGLSIVAMKQGRKQAR